MPDTIRTTDFGSIQRPASITVARVASRPTDAALGQQLRDAVVDVVRQQVEIGIDIPNDGEFGPVSWNTYLKDRLGRFELRVPEDARRGPTSRPRSDDAALGDGHAGQPVARLIPMKRQSMTNEKFAVAVVRCSRPCGSAGLNAAATAGKAFVHDDCGKKVVAELTRD